MDNHTPDIPTKQCTKCGAVYPVTTEFWYRKKTGKYGMQAKCKACTSELARQWYEENSDKVREHVRQYYANNRANCWERMRQYQKSNPEKIREQHRKYSEANRDKVREIKRKWRENNPDKARAFSRKYRKNNPDKARAHVRNRRAKLIQAEGSHTAAEVLEQFKRQRGKCYYCGDKLPKQGWHADHVIPLSRGGSNHISNIVCACPTCNMSKNDKRPHEWGGSGGRLL